jgi:hypothetical protein
MSTFDFKTELNRSNSDSRLVLDYLATLGLEGEDLSGDMSYQLRGIDFKVAGKTCELKSCRQIAKTGNIAFEIISNIETGKTGSCLTSEAEYLLYYDAVNKILHKIRLPELRRLVALGPEIKWQTAKASTNVGKNKYSSLSLLIPLDWVKKQDSLNYVSYDLSTYAQQASDIAKFLPADLTKNNNEKLHVWKNPTRTKTTIAS